MATSRLAASEGQRSIITGGLTWMTLRGRLRDRSVVSLQQVLQDRGQAPGAVLAPAAAGRGAVRSAPAGCQWHGSDRAHCPQPPQYPRSDRVGAGRRPAAEAPA
ncbi:hypothetical protein G6F68_016208 [Rhizopus microsporus]|nr:hypothetical protein G6F68_016208 [Rhizopus microsporus]